MTHPLCVNDVGLGVEHAPTAVSGLSQGAPQLGARGVRGARRPPRCVRQRRQDGQTVGPQQQHVRAHLLRAPRNGELRRLSPRRDVRCRRQHRLDD